MSATIHEIDVYATRDIRCTSERTLQLSRIGTGTSALVTEKDPDDPDLSHILAVPHLVPFKNSTPFHCTGCISPSGCRVEYPKISLDWVHSLEKIRRYYFNHITIVPDDGKEALLKDKLSSDLINKLLRLSDNTGL